jgi:hypothetical protein
MNPTLYFSLHPHRLILISPPTQTLLWYPLLNRDFASKLTTVN